MSPERLAVLSRASFATPSPLSPLQSQVDGLVGGFTEAATDWRTLTSMTAGSGAYRVARLGLAGTGSGTALRFLSVGAGLTAEVSAFEITHRSLESLNVSHIGNPNLWRWNGSGGIRQGFLQSFVTFGALKGAGRLAQGENFIAQHLFQDTAMVLGHRVTSALGLAPRAEGSLAEQFLHAEATNLQLGAGMALAGRMAPGLQALERGLDLSLRAPSPVEENPSGQPIQFFEAMEGSLATASSLRGGSASSPSKAEVNPSDHLVLSVKHEGNSSAASEEEIGNSGFHARRSPARDFSVERPSPPSDRFRPTGPPENSEPDTLPAIPIKDPPSSRGNSSSFPLRKALAVSEARYAALVKALPDPILLMDPDGNFLHVHAEREEQLFLPAEQLLGTNLRDLPFSSELKDWGLSVIQRALATGETQRVEYTVPWRDGSQHIQEARVVPDVQSDGSRAVLVVMRDVTRERRAEEIHASAQKLEALQRFSQGVAHDVGNLLVAVENYARFGVRNLTALQQLAKMVAAGNFLEDPAALLTFQQTLSRLHFALHRDSPRPEVSAANQVTLMAVQASEVLARMAKTQTTVVQQSERIKALVSDLRQLGEVEKEGPPLDLHDLLEEGKIRGILDQTENLEGQPEELVLNLTPRPWRVPGFPGNISRMIENLIVNARDAMEGRTFRRLTLSTENVTVTEEDLAQIAYPPLSPNVRPGDFTRLVLEDTGHGIDEATLRQIFEPFFTTKRRSPTKNSGSGLGLAITLNAVQNSRSFVKVWSEPEMGTRFEIYLPRMSDQDIVEIPVEAPVLFEAPLQERVLKTPVLIVDDEPLVLKVNRKMLLNAGFETVLGASDSEEALSLLEKYPDIGLALLDINLAGMNGVRLMAALQGRRAGLPCILTTGNDHHGYAKDLKEGPSLRFLDKPYLFPNLVALAHELIGASQKP